MIIDCNNKQLTAFVNRSTVALAVLKSSSFFLSWVFSFSFSSLEEKELTDEWKVMRRCRFQVFFFNLIKLRFDDDLKSV